MSLPLFYSAGYNGEVKLQLDEANSRHMVSVLRMEEGELVRLTDGKGHLLTCSITDAHKKKAVVELQEKIFIPPRPARVSIAISLVKNPSRLEWFLEKATEIGVASIIPLICHRTEKQHFRHDRMQQILVSALLQSQQAWLPELSEPVAFSRLVSTGKYSAKWIAHCLDADKRSLRAMGPATNDQLLLVGPEGDFTPEEISQALEQGFVPVTLGENRLRTETAGLVGATLLCTG